MKNLLWFTFTFTLSINLYGQAVPNGTFENWNSSPYNDPNGFNTGNLRDLQRLGTATITKVSGYAGSGLRIQSIISGPDTSESYIINTNNPCSDPPQWTGGVPYSQQPTALTGYYRYNLPGNDTAIMLVVFRKNGAHIGDNLIKVRGTGNQNTWTSFSFPLTCGGVPDSMIFAAASSNKITNVGVANGSFLELDNLAFTGATQAFPGGTFENWTAKSYDKAAGWVSWGEGVMKTTTSYLGTYAVRMETLPDMCGGSNVNSSGITTGYMTDNSGPAGGIPYTRTNDTLCGYYKYTSMGGSNAGIYVSLTKNGSPVGGNNKSLTAAAAYTYFEMPFQAGSIPDTIRIDVQSAEWPTSPSHTGSVLYLDNLYLKSAALGMPEYGEIKSNDYPNPVRDILSVQFEKTVTGPMNLFIYDVTGKSMETNGTDRFADSLKIDLTNLASGVYYYEIRTSEGITRNKFMKE